LNNLSLIAPISNYITLKLDCSGAKLYIYTISGAQLSYDQTGPAEDIHALIGHVVRQLLPAGEPFSLHDIIAALHALSLESACESTRAKCRDPHAALNNFSRIQIHP
jgi:hypothetical protein